jgi:hypothetical protein
MGVEGCLGFAYLALENSVNVEYVINTVLTDPEPRWYTEA